MIKIDDSKIDDRKTLLFCSQFLTFWFLGEYAWFVVCADLPAQ
jgi:hypothetical protein